MRLEYDSDMPRCCTPGCDSHICLSLDSPYCFKHTSGTDEEKLAEIHRRDEGKTISFSALKKDPPQ